MMVALAAIPRGPPDGVQLSATSPRTHANIGPCRLDSLGLVVAASLLLAVVAVNIAASPIWKTGIPPHAPYCEVGIAPSFQFGFAELSRQLGPVMGEPIECEHGEEWTVDTRQLTTTGVAVYHWCTNTPTFSTGPEGWMLTASGLQRWTDEDDPPTQPIVRVPDFRRPCQP